MSDGVVNNPLDKRAKSFDPLRLMPANTEWRKASANSERRHGRKNRANAELKSLQRGLLLLLNVEELIELGDLEHFVDVRVDVAQDELAARRLDLLVQGDELAERGAGKVFDVAEVQEDLRAVLGIDQVKKVLADL